MIPNGFTLKFNLSMEETKEETRNHNDILSNASMQLMRETIKGHNAKHPS